MSELEIRRRPVQARSATTFDHILNTATALLEEAGWDGFNTNLLAERAGIGIQTLYRYFPNKLSVVATLAQQLVEEWGNWQQYDRVSLLGRTGIELFVERLRSQPGGVAIRQAMAASPSLRKLDRDDTRRHAERYAAELISLDDRVNYEDAVLSILVAFEASLAVIDLTYDLPPAEADRVIGLCVEMQNTFLVNRFPILAKEIS